MTILEEILAHKREEVARAQAHRPARKVAALADSRTDPARGFRQALAEGERPRIIAELKRRSPSRGEIRSDFHPVEIARAYAAGGAAALSILTDERYFGGSPEYLERVRPTVDLPLLCKEFIVDPYQIDDAWARGADAILLIVAALDPPWLVDLQEHARKRGLDVLVEVHDEAELEVALDAAADLVGINNRDLRTFEVDLSVTERLAVCLAGAGGGVVCVAESGIHAPEDVGRLERAGADAFLVGESLMREADPGLALRELRRAL